MSDQNDDSIANRAIVPPRYAPPHMLISLLERARLLKQMEKAREQKVILLRAPGGYGKTSLLIQWWDWLRNDGAVRIWLNLSAKYSEPVTFVAGLVEAAKRAGLAIALPEETGPLAGNAFKLAHYLAEVLAGNEEEIFIFLDDYHLVRSDRVDDILDQLLRDSGPRVHFIIAARRIPGISVQTLRIEGQLSEIGFHDLSFTNEEMARFFGSGLSDDALTTVAYKTEGWPAALQMINLGLAQGQDMEILLQEFSGKNHEVAAYLAEKVLGNLPQTKIDFLIKTSILSAVNGDIADYVCERSDGWAVLGSLDELGAFVNPIAAERNWYRYHELFADFLNRRLQLLGKLEIRRLHERASAWYEKHGQAIKAIDHAKTIGDIGRVEMLIGDADTSSFWLINDFGDYTNLVNSLPASVIKRMPRLSAIKAIQLVKDGALEDARAMLQAVRKDLTADVEDNPATSRLALDLKVVDSVLYVYLDGPPDLELVADLESAVAENPSDILVCGAIQNALTLFHYRLGNMKKAAEAAQTALELYLESGSSYGAVFMHLHRGMFALVAGQLTGALSSYQRSKNLYIRYSSDPDLAELIVLFKNEALYDRGALEVARTGLTDALVHASARDSWVEVLVGGYRAASALAFAADGYRAAMAVLDEAEIVADRRAYARMAYWTRMRRIYLAAVAGELDEAKVLCEKYGIDGKIETGTDALSWHEAGKRRLALARLALANLRHEDALNHFSELRTSAQARGLGWLELKLTLLEACALSALGRMEEAAPLIEKVLEATRTETMPSLILEEGSIALDILERYVRHIGWADLDADTFDWIAELIARAPLYRPGQSLETDPYSKRELDVIEALRDGLPTKRIADKLDVSDSAIAFHLKSIFKKAGVKNRNLAVAVIEKQRAFARDETLLDGRPRTPVIMPGNPDRR